MTVLFSNNASAPIAASITTSDVTITVSSGQGSEFPSPGTGQWFYATLVDSSNNLEIVKCTSRSSDTLTVVRAQDGTSARSFAAGSLIEVRLVAAALADFQAMIVPYNHPAGSVQNFAMVTPPTGWLKANGSAILRSTYSTLFSAIGTTFGAGDGSTTFNLPDLRGEFIRNWDDSRGVDSSRVFGSSQSQTFQAHNHNTSPFLGTINFSRAMWDATGLAFLTSEAGGGPGYVTTEGGAETRPRNIALLACIKY
jgi:hypothetical protein